MSLDIKNIFNDALYWATSPQSKEKGYHISRVHDSVLRKLIHYCKNKEQVYYTNDVIASHTYLGEEQIKKSIPLLDKKRFINCSYTSRRDDNGNIIKRRGISINWPTFEKIMDELSHKGEQKTVDIAPESYQELEVENVNNFEVENVVFSGNSNSDDVDDFIQSIEPEIGYREDDIVSIQEIVDSMALSPDYAKSLLNFLKDAFEYRPRVKFGDLYCNLTMNKLLEKYGNNDDFIIEEVVVDKIRELLIE
jgi:hypothetical protein